MSLPEILADAGVPIGLAVGRVATEMGQVTANLRLRHILPEKKTLIGVTELARPDAFDCLVHLDYCCCYWPTAASGSSRNHRPLTKMPTHSKPDCLRRTQTAAVNLVAFPRLRQVLEVR